MKLIFKFLNYIFLCIILFPIYVLIRIISPIFLVRFRILTSERIGHFVGEFDTYISEKKFSKIFFFDIFAVGKDVCNYFFLKKIKKKLTIFPTKIVFVILNFIKFFGGKKHLINNTDRDLNNVIDRTKSSIKFTRYEEETGYRKLEKLGIKKKTKYICIGVRDNKYLHKNKAGIDYSYHSYRNADIKKYLLAANELTKLGYFVVRVGSVTKNKIKNKNPRIIDYSHSKLRSDFMDFFIISKCAFFISTNYGLDCVPRLFRVPILYTNEASLKNIYIEYKKSIVIFKNFFYKKLKKKLTLSEMCSEGEYIHKNKKILIEQNTKQEIKIATLQMLHKVEKKNFSKNAMQKKFNNFFLEKAKNYKFIKDNHGKIFSSQIESNFLKKNKNLFN